MTGDSATAGGANDAADDSVNDPANDPANDAVNDLVDDAVGDPVDDAVVLVDPARVQLLAVADEVLGRLPADEVPASLRAVARFTPSKRRRLGAAALAAALDSDDGFRTTVAEAATAAAPELAAAVREGGSTAASDPVDVAVMAYLTRPPGWERVAGTAAARWRAGRAPAPVAGAELDQLREEVAALRASVRGEATRLRDAAAAATADVQDELVTLRRRVRDLTRDLRAAERARDAARDDARAERERVQQEIEQSGAGHEAELRRLRGRLAEAERAAEAARRGVRTERDLDDARLWLLLDTLVQAASGVRRELSLAPPALRPADAVHAAAAAAGARAATDPAGLDALLALPHVHLVVDGYNVTKTGYPELPLIDQRGRLIGALAALVAQSGAEVTIAFDGAGRPPAQPATPRGVRVLFSAADEIADDLIRRLVAAEPVGRTVVVVTSDQEIVRDVGRAGAWTVPSAVLLARLG